MGWITSRGCSANGRAAGHPVDVLSVHFYPQGGEYQRRRLASDAAAAQPLHAPALGSELCFRKLDRCAGLSDPAHEGVDSSDYYAGTPVAITEYNWGAEEPHQRRDDPGRHLRHIRPRGSRYGHALDRAGQLDADLQGDADVSQLRRRRIGFRRHERFRRAPPIRTISPPLPHCAAERSGAMTVMVISKD